jgi:hypothetical protein
LAASNRLAGFFCIPLALADSHFQTPPAVLCQLSVYNKGHYKSDTDWHILSESAAANTSIIINQKFTQVRYISGVVVWTGHPVGQFVAAGYQGGPSSVLCKSRKR